MKTLIRQFRMLSTFRSVWMTFVLLFVSVMAPTLTVIWLVKRASENEQLALQQVLVSSRLREATLLRNQVTLLTGEWHGDIQNLLIEKDLQDSLPALLSAGLGEALVFAEDAHPTPEGDSWPYREHLDEIRFLSQSFGKEAAIEQIRSDVGDPAIQHNVMPDGSLLHPYLLLLGIEYGKDAGVDVSDLEDHLVRILTYEREERMPASQRRFLLNQMVDGDDGERLAPFSRAAQLAYYWKRQGNGSAYDRLGKGFRTRDDLVYLSFPDRDVVWLMRFDTFEQRLLDTISDAARGDRVSIRLLKPGMIVKEDPANFDVLDMGAPMEGWRLMIGNPGLAEIGSGADRHIEIYVWVGALAILISVALVFLSMGMVRRQVAMAQFKNDLVATVSHELKTPVTSIRLLVETLLDDPKADKEKVKDYLQLISNENHRLGHLVQRFLTFSRMERNENYFDFQPTPVPDVVYEVEQVFRERFPVGDFELNVECACDKASMSLDREAMVSAIGNLMENAYKYSNRDKKIVLRCYQLKHEMAFEVEDNGVGIPKHERARIFKKFYQPDRRLNKHKGGVGLGLSIVSLVVRAHKGKVEVESEPGKGSCFRILIPHA